MKRKTILLIALIIICNLSSVCFAQQGVAINTTGVASDNSAILDVSSNNKGLLIPRVSLTSATDVVTIPSPAVSLLVYNTGTGGLLPAGFYYWDGTQWTNVIDSGTGGGGGYSFVKPKSWEQVAHVGVSANYYTDIESYFAVDFPRFYFEVPGSYFQSRSITAVDFPTAINISSAVCLNGYLYVKVMDGAWGIKVFQYDITNISAGGIEVVPDVAFGANPANTMMTSDGTDLYFNYEASNSATSNVISKYKITGTYLVPTLTWDSNITCVNGVLTDTFGEGIAVANGDIYGSQTGTDLVSKFSNVGVLITSVLFRSVNRLVNFGGILYTQGSSSMERLEFPGMTNFGTGGSGCGSGSSSLTLIPKPVGQGTVAGGNRQMNSNTTAYVYLVSIPFTITVNKISIRPNICSTPGTYDLTMYSEDGATQIFSVTTATLTALTLETTAVSSITIQPGNYWMMINPNGATDCYMAVYANDVGAGVFGTTEGILYDIAGEPILQGTLIITAGTPPATITPTSITALGDCEVIFRLDN